MDLIEDETHFLVDCEFYSDIRFNLFQSAQYLKRISDAYFLGDLLFLFFIFICFHYEVGSKLDRQTIYFVEKTTYQAEC